MDGRLPIQFSSVPFFCDPDHKAKAPVDFLCPRIYTPQMANLCRKLMVVQDIDLCDSSSTGNEVLQGKLVGFFVITETSRAENVAARNLPEIIGWNL